MSKILGERWEIVNQLGEGGQSHVFRVNDLKPTDKSFPNYALKRLKNLKRIERFEKEIKANIALDHPGIPKIIDYSLKDPAYYVSVLSSTQTLEDVASLGLLTSLDLFLEICKITKFCHEKGIIHRDLKPENILVNKDLTPQIIDFGLCYFEDENSKRLTETMEQVGSRFYMAPEMEKGRAENVDRICDVYSLGKILYFLLTRKHLARELFMDDNNIVGTLNNRQCQYINERIFSNAIVENPSKRKDLDYIIKETIEVKRLMQEHFYPGKEGSVCRFCGEGLYEKIKQGILRIGFSTPLMHGDKEMNTEFLVCPKCKNVQWFFTNDFQAR